MSNTSFIADRGVFDPLAYSVNLKPEKFSDLADRCIKHYKQSLYSLIIFLAPVLDLKNDGTRVMDRNYQIRVSQDLECIYRRFEISYTTITETNLNKMLKIVREMIDKL